MHVYVCVYACVYLSSEIHSRCACLYRTRSRDDGALSGRRRDAERTAIGRLGDGESEQVCGLCDSVKRLVDKERGKYYQQRENVPSNRVFVCYNSSTNKIKLDALKSPSETERQRGESQQHHGIGGGGCGTFKKRRKKNRHDSQTRTRTEKSPHTHIPLCAAAPPS